MNRGSFYSFKKGEMNISLDKLISISEAFKVELDALVFTDMSEKSDMVNIDMAEVKQVLEHYGREIEDIKSELKNRKA